MTTLLRIAAFSDGNTGSNPAGVWIGDALPDASRMQAIAAEVGFSETALAAPKEESWRVRYFSPAMEVTDPRRDRRSPGQLDPGLRHGALHGGLGRAERPATGSTLFCQYAPVLPDGSNRTSVK
jgi:hypothetical protein